MLSLGGQLVKKTATRPRQGIVFARTAVAAAVAVSFSGGAYAQATTPPAEEAQELEAIEVTGSRIPRPQLESASPVTVIEREEILATGITDVGDLLQRLPSMSGSPIGTTTNNGGNGSVQIDLRGMGVNRTLTLVNGRRTVDGGDYQTIPASMIERVEILKDGGSAAYGADAVAGVVNIITRRDFSGISADVQKNDWYDVSGGGQTAYNVVVGNNFDGGNFVFGAEYVDQKHAYQSDAPWSFFQNSYYIYPEGCENQVTAPYPTGCYPIGSSRIPEGLFRFATQGFYMNSDGDADLEAWDGRTYNYAPVNYIQTPYQRTNLFANGTFDLTDNLRFTTEFRGNFRQSAQELAPQPYNSPTDPGYGFTFDVDGNGVPENYNGISQDNYYLVQYATASGLAIEPVRDARRRILEVPRRFTQDITQYQAVAGLSGTFNDLDWDASYNRGYRSRSDRDFGQWSGPRLEAGLGPSADLDGDGAPECYRDVTDPSTIIDGCVPVNLFAGPGLMPADQLAYLNLDLTDTFITTIDEISANVNGSAMALPGGKLGWALGFQYLGQHAEYNPDSAKQLDLVTGNTGAGTNGSLFAKALVGEVYAPVFDNGAQSVALTAGLRFDDYNLFGNETTWQLGVEFNPIQALKLRATGSTVFRAPTIGELFAGEVDSFPTYTDPCNVPDVSGLPGCAQSAPAPTDSQVLARVGGNPALQPESGNTLTFGVVWEPSIPVGQFSATLDYWNIQLDDGISSLGVQYILDNCAATGAGDTCSLIMRNPDYTVAQVRDTALNVAEQSAAGIDTEFRYGFAPGVGRVNLALLWTHLIERTKVAFPGDPENDLSGRYTDPTAQDGGAYANDKFNYSARWTIGGLPFGELMVGYLGEYISALDADTFCNCDSDGNPANNTPDGRYIQQIDAQLYHDLVAEATLPMGFKLMAGITNVTDEEPPYIEVGFNATTDPSTYRMFGRGYFLRAAYEFR